MITAVNGQATATTAALSNVIEAKKPGQVVSLTVGTEAGTETIQVRLAQAPVDFEALGPALGVIQEGHLLTALGVAARFRSGSQSHRGPRTGSRWGRLRAARLLPSACGLLRNNVTQ